MVRSFVLVLLLALVTSPAEAKPDWTTIAGYLPEASALVISLNVDRQARAGLVESLPLEPAVVGRVLDEQFGAFARSTGLNPLDATEIFAGAGATEKGDLLPVVGVKVPVDRAKVVETIKSSGLGGKGWELTETDGAVLLKKGKQGWAFVPAGVVLWGAVDALLPVLKRKGAPAATNKDLLAVIRERSIEAGRLYVRAVVPAGFLPGSLPPKFPAEKYGVPRDLPAKVASTIVITTADDVAAQWEFRDDATAKKVEAALNGWLKELGETFEAEVKRTGKEAERLGVLAPLAPELVSAKVNLASFGDVASGLTVQATSRALTLKILTKSFGSVRALGGAGLAGLFGTTFLSRVKALAGGQR